MVELIDTSSLTCLNSCGCLQIGVSLLVGVVGGMLTNLLYERLNLSPKPKPPLKELMYRLESLEARGLFEEQEKEEVDRLHIQLLQAVPCFC